MENRRGATKFDLLPGLPSSQTPSVDVINVVAASVAAAAALKC